MRRSRNLPLPAGRLDYIIFVSGINSYFYWFTLHGIKPKAVNMNESLYL